MTTSHDIEQQAIAEAEVVCRAYRDEAHDLNANAVDDAGRERSAMAVLIATTSLTVLREIRSRKTWMVETNLTTGTIMKLRSEKFEAVVKRLEGQITTWEHILKEPSRSALPEAEIALAENNAAIWRELVDRVRKLS